ncbi:peptide ABC transporter substrate-binding protein [Catellatospora sp. TT07R-123]|uniref:peptide ABC transporter substrate-binding protein n=1 Tax=Catellatospora sp. TT07R-123 TaxID=2733863 RepID=UPI001B1BBA0C|nr:ABC transporter substrate-binding protein [Catellatospora sp. TT07R-123]GHJ46032.1 peptide ABC transporter substrate-binding protein [Catellatospora sp. TT07R-123]
MQVRRLAAWAALPLAVTLGLTACGKSGGSDTGSTNPNGVVSVGIAEPKHLIPTNTAETSGSQVLAALFAPLVDFDEANKPYEVAAQEISTTDNKTWTIKLKDGWTFHNGEPVTADNYINAWNYGAYAPNAQDNNYFFDKVEGYAALNPADAKTTPTATTLSGLKKVDDKTFTVTLSAPFSEFKSLLGYTAFYPLPKAAWESDTASPLVLSKSFEDAPIGNGPFKIKGAWNHDSGIEVEKYDAFAGTKPSIGGANFKIYQNDAAEYADLQANNLDVIKQIPTDSLATVQGDLGDRYQTSPASTLQVLAFPTFDPRFSKVEVRKAISMAIDREEIVNKVFQGSQKAAYSFVSPVVAGYRDKTCGAACEFNPTEAKKMYDAAGGPKSLNITYNADGGHQAWVDATCNQLKTNLGVECVGTPEPKFADLLTKVKAKKDVGMFRMGWVMDYPSMENYLGPLYSTTGSSNYYGYSNPAFDNLLKEGAAAATQDEAIKKYQAAEDLLAQDLPVMPLRFGQNVFGHSTKVKDVSIDLFNRVDLNKIQYVG